MRKTIGFIGLGRMGYLMAGKIAQARPLNVWNRTWKVGERHALEYKSKVFSSIIELGNESDVVITCLPTSAEVEKVSRLLLTTTTRIMIDCTSGDPRQTQAIGKHMEGKIHMLDCPVSGGPAKAALGTLCAMVGGDRGVYDNVVDIIQLFSEPEHVGELGHGHAIKAVNNMLNVCQLCMASAGIQSLKEIGVKPIDALNVINKSSGRSLMTQERIPVDIITAQYNYGFSLGLMRKDLKIAMDIVGKRSPVYPMMQSVYDLMLLADDDEDYTTITKYL
jgi:3-hydroxyisobutyrate dehydrogenase